MLPVSSEETTPQIPELKTGLFVMMDLMTKEITQLLQLLKKIATKPAKPEQGCFICLETHLKRDSQNTAKQKSVSCST